MNEDQHAWVVKGKDDILLANLYMDRHDGRIRVVRYPSCSLGMYFYILSLLLDLGYEVK